MPIRLFQDISIKLIILSKVNVKKETLIFNKDGNLFKLKKYFYK